jgi:rSAM/selenodomain-associated transferase 1
VRTQLVVVAKEPLPGKVKTRLCPPCTPEQAAQIAAASLADTIDAVTAAAAQRRILLLDGHYSRPPGWQVVAQRGDGLGQRLAYGFADTATAGVSTIVVGMDTPQLTPELINTVAAALSTSDAALGLAEDGGWWVLGLRDPRHAAVLVEVPMSQPDTGERTLKALTELALSVALCPVLRDVDTITDLGRVAAQCPGGRFAAAVNALGLG